MEAGHIVESPPAPSQGLPAPQLRVAAASRRLGLGGGPQRSCRADAERGFESNRSRATRLSVSWRRGNRYIAFILSHPGSRSEPSPGFGLPHSGCRLIEALSFFRYRVVAGGAKHNRTFQI